MMTIPMPNWRRSLDAVSRSFAGAMVSVDVDRPDLGVHAEVRSQPLAGITADRSGIIVQVARGAEHLGHTIPDAEEIRFEETSEGALRTVEVDSRDGTRTYVRFRSPLLAALLDPNVE
jgi:hypothetical protein